MHVYEDFPLTLVCRDRQTGLDWMNDVVRYRRAESRLSDRAVRVASALEYLVQKAGGTLVVDWSEVEVTSGITGGPSAVATAFRSLAEVGLMRGFSFEKTEVAA